MKKYTHAWLALKAVELLKSHSGDFNKSRNERLERFLEFISTYPSTFARGAWFPDTIIKDNVKGGHTWKYSLDSAKGKKVNYRPPSHNQCLKIVKSKLEQKVSLQQNISDLPDRCEALSQTVRDMILITNALNQERYGDVIIFNNSQVANFFLMLSHYICDAHVPVHCDSRDFYKPSKVHPDLEAFWETEIKKYYKVSTKKEQFDLDENQNLQRNMKREGFENSILHECDKILSKTTWADMKGSGDWRKFLGKTNKNLWDYLVSVCLVSFHMSLEMFPAPAPAGVNYNKVRIMNVSPFKETVIKYSPKILADAINSVALLWLATWERWELLAKGIR